MMKNIECRITIDFQVTDDDNGEAVIDVIPFIMTNALMDSFGEPGGDDNGFQSALIGDVFFKESTWMRWLGQVHTKEKNR